MNTMNTSTNHAEARIQERLAQAGWSTTDQGKLFFAASALAERTDQDSEAIRLAVLPGIVGKVWGEKSNGNEVWGIYRNRNLVTVMLRRSTQPDSNLRVAVVNRLV